MNDGGESELDDMLTDAGRRRINMKVEFKGRPNTLVSNEYRTER